MFVSMMPAVKHVLLNTVVKILLEIWLEFLCLVNTLCFLALNSCSLIPPDVRYCVIP